MQPFTTSVLLRAFLLIVTGCSALLARPNLLRGRRGVVTIRARPLRRGLPAVLGPAPRLVCRVFPTRPNPLVRVGHVVLLRANGATAVLGIPLHSQLG